MPEAFIKALISILVLVACVFIFLWVLGVVGLHLPYMVVNIIWVIVALVCLLVLFRLLRPHIGGWLP